MPGELKSTIETAKPKLDIRDAFGYIDPDDKQRPINSREREYLLMGKYNPNFWTDAEGIRHPNWETIQDIEDQLRDEYARNCDIAKRLPGNSVTVKKIIRTGEAVAALNEGNFSAVAFHFLREAKRWEDMAKEWEDHYKKDNPTQSAMVKSNRRISEDLISRAAAFAHEPDSTKKTS